ncbi:MAG: type III pantothenate kinase [Myxococcales bacterium]|nr:type III pantothenate kinase [Myxococcales bacterium]
MLLSIDIGNTNIVLGVFSGDELLHHWRLQSHVGRTSDEYTMLVWQLLHASEVDHKAIGGAIIASVVPPLQEVFVALVESFLGLEPMIVGPGIKTGMPILYENPREVGADRIVNAVAAFEEYKQGLLIVDFGTATTFDAISPRGEYMGGAIAPGIGISMDALFRATAKLPRVEFSIPKRVIGRNTVTSIQSGIVFGYTGLVDGIIDRMEQEAAFPLRVVATGGHAQSIASLSRRIEIVDPLLTLKGLRLLYERNAANPAP